MKNPFEFGRELAPEELVDREDEVADVVGAIMDQRKLFIIGPRRFGKTSILKTAEALAEAQGAVVLRFDAQAYPALNVLIEHILSRAADHLLGPMEKAREAIGRVFGSLRPEVSFNPVDQTWSVSLTPHMSRQPSVRLLVDALDALEQLASGSDRPVALIIDEFQQILEDKELAAEQQIRAAIQTHRHVAYILAGSATRLLSEMTGDSNRPFYRLGSRIFVGPVPEEDFREFLHDQFEQGGFTASHEVVDEILRLAESVPYNVQRLAHGCWDLLVEREETTLTTDHVQEALELWVRRDDPFYTQDWAGLTTTQKKAIIAVVRNGGSGLYGKNVLKELDLTSSSLQAALTALDRAGILRSEQKEGAIHWRLEDPFFGAWVRLIVLK